MNTNIKMAKVITVTTAYNTQGKALKIVTTVAANADLKLLLLRMGLAPELVTCEVSNIMPLPFALEYNVDPIHEAIAKNSQITFLYFDYVIGRNFSKERHYMNKKERYVASPWAMIYTDDNYYLLAYHDGKMKHFRVDRMEDVELRTVEQNGLKVIVPREGKEEYDKKDMSTYTNYTFSMYGGEVKNVEMVFLNRMLNTVIDRFGKDVLAYPVDKNHFKITVPVAVSDQFFGWIFGLGNYVTIVGPEDVKEKMKASLAKVAKRYEK